MNAVIIEDETAAVGSLKAILFAKHHDACRGSGRTGEYRGKRYLFP